MAIARTFAPSMRSRLKANKRGNAMRCHWEKLGVLAPIYELVARGLSDHEIAGKLNLTEVTVRDCTSWLMHFLKRASRAELVQYASPAQHEIWGLHSTHIAA
jgi:DNA-binding NarL/FixJ family response regulator